jgi:outer membrane protein assembly factor BamB
LLLLLSVSIGTPASVENSKQEPTAGPDQEIPCWDLSDGTNEHIIWRAKIGRISGPPIIHDGKILIGTNNTWPHNPQLQDDRGVLLCLHKATGAFVGQSTHPRLSHRANDIPQAGLRCRPCVEGNRVYYTSNRGELVCLRLGSFQPDKECQILWKLDMIGGLGVFKRDAWDIGNPLSSPLVLGDLVYVVTGNGSTYGYAFPGLPYVPTPDAPSFLAVNKWSGKVSWSNNAPGKDIMYGQWSSPVAAQVNGGGQVLFPGGDGFLYGFEPTSGRLLWKVDLNDPTATPWGPEGPGTRCFFVATPTVHKNMLYVGLNQDLEKSSSICCPLHAVDLDRVEKEGRGAIRWTFGAPDFLDTVASVVVSGDVLYTLSGGGMLFAIDIFTGKELWRSRLASDPEHPYADSFFSSPVLDNGKLFVPSREQLFIFEVGREKKPLGRFDFGAVHMSTPFVRGKTVYLATEKYVWAIRYPGNQ